MSNIQEFITQTVFLLSNLHWFGLVDLALVTASFYFILNFIYRSTSAYILREFFIMGITLFILTAILPLPVFDWVVRGFLITMLISIPIIFQAQIRQSIERTSRAIGMRRVDRQDALETLLPEIANAVEEMAETKTGALIVIEANNTLNEVIQTGVRSGGQVTTEFLESVFYEGTPLHDGAIIIRENKVAAAGCVLPLTKQSLEADKRLGTRHRAAVGMSEASDALIIVVSEETGQISIAYQGELHRPLTIVELREKLIEFYKPFSTEETMNLSLWSLSKQAIYKLFDPKALLNTRKIFVDLGLLAASLFLALIVWTFVIQQTTPLQIERIENIALTVENIPKNVHLEPAPPKQVAAIIQTTEDILPTLSARSFQAKIAFESDEPNLYRLPVTINSSEETVLVTGIDPTAIDVRIIPIISRTVPVVVNPLRQQALSPAYEIVGNPLAIPNMVEIIGPQPNVEQVTAVETNLSIENATSTIQETRPLRAVDSKGLLVPNITITPDQVEATIVIQRKRNARDVSVHAVINGPPPLAYWLSNVRIIPSSVTLQGPPNQLTSVGSYVNTLPIDVTQATGNLSFEMPLDLPANVEATDNDGKVIQTVIVEAQVLPRNGNTTEVRLVDVLTNTQNLTISVSPPEINILISGPLPVLHEIEKNPDLIQAWVEATSLRPGQQMTLTPTLLVPPNITAQSSPPAVVVTAQR